MGMQVGPSGRRPQAAFPARRIRFVVALAAIACAAGCAGPKTQPSPSLVTSGRDSLPGKIYDVRAASFLSEQELVARLVGPRFILLGEQHDNPDHHALQGQVLELLLAAGTRPVVAFEMLSTDRSGAIRDCQAVPACEIEEFRHAVEWDASGWPDWELYRPIFVTAIGAGLRIDAADIPPSAIRLLSSPSPTRSDIRAEWLRALRLDRRLNDGADDELIQELREAHCNLLPEELIPNLAIAQRARDAHLAMVTERAAATPGAVVVLIAGLGHTRTDRGVPAYFADPAARNLTLSLGFVEAARDAVSVRDAADEFGGEFPFDIVWFTDRVEREDPCEGLQRRMDAMKP